MYSLEVPQQFKALTDSNPSNCLYAIVHIASGKTYIGQTIQPFKTRLSKHLSDLRIGDGRHGNWHLQRSFNKYGESAFVAYVVELAPDLPTLDRRERELIAQYKAAGMSFNMHDGGDGASGVREAAKRREKEWKLLGPDNQIVTFRNYQRFCSDRDLKPRHVWAVLKEKRSVYQGWRNVSALETFFLLTNPSGKQVITNNLVALAQKHGIDPGKLYIVARGKSLREYAGFYRPDRPPKPKASPRVIQTEDEKAEKARQASKAHYWADPGKYRTYAAEYYERRKNDDDYKAKRKERQRLWKQRNREHVRAKQREYTQAYKARQGAE